MLFLAILSWASFAVTLVIVVRLLRRPDAGFGGATWGARSGPPAQPRRAVRSLGAPPVGAAPSTAQR